MAALGLGVLSKAVSSKGSLEKWNGEVLQLIEWEETVVDSGFSTGFCS